MSLTVLTAPTVAEATAYINAHYTAFSPLRVNWTALDAADQLVYINQSYDEINGLVFKQYTPYDNVLNIISENALAIMDKDIGAASDMQFKTLQSLGQQKNSKYNRREQGDVIGINTATEVKANIPITGQKAYAMLKIYLGGSFKIL